MQIRIVPHEPRHAPLLFEAARESIRQAHPWLSWCHPAYSIPEAEYWTSAQIEAFRARSAFNFVIESLDGHFLGGCGLDSLDTNNQRCNLGYWVRTAWAGRGIASSAVRVLSAWAFSSTDLVRLEILASVENVASRRVAENAGARFEGILRSRLLLHGRHHDAALYSIVKGDPTRE